MKKILLILLLLFLQSLKAEEPVLQLDTGGHTVGVWDVIATESGDIITASIDKTIRVWDSKTGKEKRKILGQIGKGGEGKIYAIALSPDEKELAVGGVWGEPGAKNAIRIYHYHTGKLLKLLKSHTSSVFDLSYSPDGKYLISGSMDKTAKIWDTKTLSLVDTITQHTKEVYAVKIVKKASTYLAITAGLDKQIALYDLEKKEIVKKVKLNNLLIFLATTSNHIAVCGLGREIQIFDYSLNLIKKIISETSPVGLSYSPNEKLLIAGANRYPFSVNIYNKENNYSLITTFKKHKNTTKVVTFLNNNLALTAGGVNNEIYIWNSKTAEVKRKIEGVGTTVWSVGVKGDIIGWGNKFDAKGDYHKKQSSIQKTLNLKTFKVNSEKRKVKNLKRISTTNGNLSLTHTRGEYYGYSDATLILKKDQEIITKITRGSTNGYGHSCYGFYKNHIISGGENGYLKIYNQKGKEVANLVGHTGQILSIALDGDRLVSGSRDQTIRVWDLSKLETKDEKLKLVNSSYFNNDWKAYISKTYPSIDITKKNDIKKLYHNLLRDYGEAEASKLLYTYINIYPQLNLFVSKNDEWVIWTKSGYFNSSIGGDKYIGYHINQGVDREAYFVSSSKYYKKLYRPDIIEAVIETGSEKRAFVAISDKREIEKPDIVSEAPPILTLLGSSYLTTAKSTTAVNFAIQSNTPIEKFIISRNGEKIEPKVTDDGKNKTILVDLDEGENIIAIRAKNQYAISDDILVTATRESKRGTAGSTAAKPARADIYKPTLYLLSIGVSRYKNSQYNLEVADKDAKSIIELFKKQEGKIYKKVVVKQLLNEDASKDNILDALDWVERETTQRDLAIIFVAGHGINDDKGNYYFMGYDSDVEKLRRTAIRWIEIKDTIVGLPSKVILMVDTCHSGNIMGQQRRRDLTGAIKSIINSGTGSVIMTASTGRGYSIEKSDWGHGAFTKALLEGLGKAKADFNRDETISIKEIDLYITYRVKKLTKGKQKPTTIIPESVPDFALGVK